MAIPTANFGWNKPEVNAFIDSDVWGFLLNENLDSQDSLIYLLSTTGLSTTRPAYANEGTLWVDNTNNPWIFYIYDGIQDVPIGQINTSTHQFTPINGTVLNNKGDLLTSDGTANQTLPVGLDGQFLSADSTAPYGIAWTFAPTVVQKVSDETRISNNTLTNDSTLLFNMDANANYIIEVLVFYNSNSAQSLQFTFNGTATPIRVLGNVNTSGTANNTLTNVFFTSYNTNYTLTSQVSGFISANILVQNGTNSGTFSFQWAQNTSSTNPLTVLGGSYIRYT
jgi:hypothetical protein